MIGPQERTARLKRIAILSSLTEAELEQVARRCKWREYGPGEQVCGYQDAVTDVLFLLAGKARVIIYSAEGKGVVFADLTPSTMFGEIAAIDGCALGQRGGPRNVHDRLPVGQRI